jgi:hypothetical protein
MIFPALLENNIPVFGLLEVGIAIGIVGITSWVILRSLSKWNIVPKGDAYLNESLELHT